jgi:hypothetical protein
MSERPTKTITTTNGHTAVLHEWITMQEFRAITGVFTRNATLQNVDLKKETADVAGSFAEAAMEAQDLAVGFVVVELNGSKEDILERVRNMRNEDAQEIIQAIEDVTNPKKK